MTRLKKYDHVFLVSNDLVYDRRMDRICDVLSETNSVLLLGRWSAKKLPKRSYDQHRVKCLFHSGPLFYAELNIRLFWYGNMLSVHSVTSTDYDTLLAGKWLARKQKCHFYFDAHEYFEEVPELRSTIKKYIWTMIAKWSIPYTLKRYTVSNSLAEELDRKYNRSFQVIRNLPVSNSKFSTKNKSMSPFRLVYLGMLHQGRGLKQLIDVIGDIPDACLDLIGEGDLTAELQDYAIAKSYHHRIVFHGMLTESDFSNILFQSHAGVNLLDGSSRSYYYSLANKFFDYIHHGLPVLTMNFPEYRHYQSLYQCCVLIDSLEHDEIKKGIVRILNNYTDYTDKIDMARQENCWIKESEKLLNIYNPD